MDDKHSIVGMLDKLNESVAAWEPVAASARAHIRARGTRVCACATRRRPRTRRDAIMRLLVMLLSFMIKIKKYDFFVKKIKE